MSNNRKIFMAVFCLLSIAINAQNSDRKRITDLFDKAQKLFDLKNYYLESDYKLFVNYTSNEVKEAYKGITLKKGENMYTKLGSSEMISTNNLFIKIDNDNKRMKVDKISSNAQKPILELNSYINYFSGYRLTESNGQWICTLTTSKVSVVPYSKIIVYINKNDYQIQKQELFFLTKYQTKIVNGKPKLDYPRLQIIYSNFKKSGFPPNDYFNVDNYVKKTNQKYYPIKKYKSYTIVD
ncbi:hypothetical protein [Flavobacterium wongokense]|uniref:hypothetical protein n=1 Tax=Flavobacterium wongokense TaxID=2910674 RepID=UPI001F1BB6E2|nr:hypothetical protein [Flavobacterium sp. WG47]MCF6133252.1 hypothetical protein [Flavobacterium sp. WG47]